MIWNYLPKDKVKYGPFDKKEANFQKVGFFNILFT
jgi:hypothetical protein